MKFYVVTPDCALYSFDTKEERDEYIKVSIYPDDCQPFDTFPTEQEYLIYSAKLEKKFYGPSPLFEMSEPSEIVPTDDDLENEEVPTELELSEVSETVEVFATV